MSVTFKLGATSVEISNPQVGDTRPVKLEGALAQSAGGEHYWYSKGVTNKKIALRFAELRLVEKTALEDFFITTVVGPTTEFEFKDQYGIWYNVQFESNELNFSITDDAKDSSTTFSVGGEGPFPTHILKNPVFSVDVDLFLLSVVTTTTTTTTTA